MARAVVNGRVLINARCDLADVHLHTVAWYGAAVPNDLFSVGSLVIQYRLANAFQNFMDRRGR